MTNDELDWTVIGMLGMALTAYDGAADDIIALLRNSKDEVRLTAVGTCAVLDLKDALPQLQKNAEVLTNQMRGTKETDSDGGFIKAPSDSLDTYVDNDLPLEHEENVVAEVTFISEHPDSELAAVQFTRAYLGDNVPFTWMDTVTTQMSEGLIGFLGCCLPILELQHFSDYSFPFLELGMEIISLKFLDPWAFGEGFLLVPHFWQQLVAQDLAHVIWLNEEDRRVLLASLPLMLVQAYSEASELTAPSDLPTSKDAMEQFSSHLGIENKGEHVLALIVSTVQNLTNELIAIMDATPFEQSITSITLLPPEQFLAPDETGNLSWEVIQERAKTIANRGYLLLNIEHSSSRHTDLYKNWFYLLLMLAGDKAILWWLKETDEIKLTGNPDATFFTKLKDLGRHQLICGAVYMWGVVMIQLLQKMYGDTELGSDFLSLWKKRSMEISLIFRDEENGWLATGHYQKQNPLATVFEPF